MLVPRKLEQKSTVIFIQSTFNNGYKFVNFQQYLLKDMKKTFIIQTNITHC